MIEFILIGIASGLGFVMYHSKWLDKLSKKILDVQGAEYE